MQKVLQLQFQQVPCSGSYGRLPRLPSHLHIGARQRDQLEVLEGREMTFLLLPCDLDKGEVRAKGRRRRTEKLQRGPGLNHFVCCCSE